MQNNDWKAIAKKLLFLPVSAMIVLVCISGAGLLAVFLRGLGEELVAIPVYVLSAYTLTVLCIFFASVFPRYYRETKAKIYAHPLGYRYMTDVSFKVRVSLYISLGINSAYAVFKLLVGIFYSSSWWGAIGIYYMLLAIVRFLLLRYMRSDVTGRGRISEYKRYRLSGILMLILNLTLSVVIAMVLREDKTFSYPGFLIFVAAAYTFYSVTISIVDLIRYRKYKSPVMSAAKALRFAAALVSLFSLEIAMLVQFGEGNELFNSVISTLTGIGVSVCIYVMSIYMIVHATKMIKTLRLQRAD